MGLATPTGGDSPVYFAAFLILIELAFLITYATVVEYPDAADPSETAEWDRINWYYPMYQDLHVMIFVGFGFLMTFLVKYSWSSVSYTLLVSCLCIRWGILVDGFWRCALNGRWEYITMGIDSAVLGDFAAATVLISFGGLLGRITPTQLLAMAFLEIPFYAFNKEFCIKNFKAVDMGGGIYIHTFGAYFGLAVSAAVGSPKGDLMKAENLNASIYTSDLFAMIGTIFLFMFWPSFNAAMCPDNNFARERVIVNTVLAICGSCMIAFACSRLFETSKKFNMVHIQNATLAGGVAIGTSSSLILSPYPAMLIGMIAGTLSTFGYVFISPFLERKGLRDTCGINNLHGMPGVLGGIASIFTAWLYKSADYGDISVVMPARGKGRSGAMQGVWQLVALAMTVFVSIISGLLVGKFLTSQLFHREINTYSDKSHWQVGDDEAMENVVRMSVSARSRTSKTGDTAEVYAKLDNN